MIGVIDLQEESLLSEFLTALNFISESEPNCIPNIYQLGGVEKVLSTLKSFKSNLDISKASMVLLETLLSDNSNC